MRDPKKYIKGGGTSKKTNVLLLLPQRKISALSDVISSMINSSRQEVGRWKLDPKFQLKCEFEHF